MSEENNNEPLEGQTTLPGMDDAPPAGGGGDDFQTKIAEMEQRLVDGDRERRELKHQLKQNQLPEGLANDPDALLKHFGKDPDALFWDKWAQMGSDGPTQEEVPQHAKDLKNQLERQAQEMQQLQQQQWTNNKTNEFSGFMSNPSNAENYDVLAAAGKDGVGAMFQTYANIMEREGVEPDMQRLAAETENMLHKQGQHIISTLQKSKKFSDVFGSKGGKAAPKPGKTLSGGDGGSSDGEVDTSTMTEKQRFAYNLAWAKKKAEADRAK